MHMFFRHDKVFGRLLIVLLQRTLNATLHQGVRTTQNGYSEGIEHNGSIRRTHHLTEVSKQSKSGDIGTSRCAMISEYSRCNRVGLIHHFNRRHQITRRRFPLHGSCKYNAGTDGFRQNQVITDLHTTF